MTPRRLLIAGFMLSALVLVLIVVAPADALRAWLAATFLWSGVPIGSLGLLMSIHLIGGRWGYSLPPILEAGSLALPIIGVAILPVLGGMAVLYPWVGAPAAGFKGGWLSPLPFTLRTLILFAGLGLALWALVRRRGSAMAVSSIGLIFLAPVMSVVLVDWLLSLDPEFHSSGFGLYGMSIQFTVALMAAIWVLLGRQPQHVAALAALTITLVLSWLYLAFTSYFVIWSGDLASVVGWYKVRGAGGWGAAYAVSAIIEAVVFFVLLFPRPRRSPEALRAIAAAMIIGKAIEAAWLVLPQAGGMSVVAIALYIAAAVGLGLIVIQAQQLLLDGRIAERAPDGR